LSKFFCCFSSLSTLSSINSNSFCLIFDFNVSVCVVVGIGVVVVVVVVFVVVFDFDDFDDVFRERERCLVDFLVVLNDMVVVEGVVVEGVVVLVVTIGFFDLNEEVLILVLLGFVVVFALIDNLKLID